MALSYIIAFSYSTENNIVNTDNNENMVNEIVVAKKLRRIAVIFCIMHLHNEYYFVVDVVVTIAIFMQPWEVPIFDQPC